MISGHDGPSGSQQERGGWFTAVRCSICTSSIWFTPIALTEPVEAPEPRHEWILCKSCHRALLVELRRSTVGLPVRLRIAVGLVASERFPFAPDMRTRGREQREFQQEFTWVIRFMVFFALLHLVIFALVLTVPK